MRILVIEDDALTAETLSILLSGQNYAVDIAPTRAAALELIDAFTFDLVLLDVVMPDGDGIGLCRKLRAEGQQMPILMLTGRDSGHDKAIGLDAGADDYVVKPFNAEELSARIRALLRRGIVPAQPVLEWDALRLDPSSCEVSYGAKLLTLTPKEYALLELFLRNSRRVFSCGVILEQIWSFEEMPGEEAVRTHIKGLRQKLKAKGAPPDFIETVYGIGYRLKAPDLLEAPPGPSDLPKTAQQQTLQAIAQVWQKFKGQVEAQVQVLEQATHASLNGSLGEDLRQQAERQAHSLAGALGTFGLATASQQARTLEQWLQQGAGNGQAQARQMLAVVRSLQQDIERPLDVSAPAPTTAAPPEPAEPLTSHAHLMLVDDDPTMLATVKTLLEPWGLQVTTLADPRQFWQTLEAAAPNLLILDIQMPYRSGIELCQEVRDHERWGGLPIMILTAHMDADTVNQVFAVGADDFVSKPIVGPELVNRILHRLERVRLWQRFSQVQAHPLPIGLSPSETQFRLLVDGIEDYAIYMLDLAGNIVSWNRGAEQIKGYAAAEILGQSLAQLYLEEEASEGKPQQDLAIARSEGHCEFLGWRRRQDGSCFWGDVVITALRGGDQFLQGYAVVTRDITDRKQMDEALQRSRDKLEVRVAERTAELVGVNERLRRELEERKRAQEALRVSQVRFAGILDIADDAIISVNATQHITLFNQGAEKIFGYTAQEVMGQSLGILLPSRYVAAHQGHVQEFGDCEGNARRMGDRREIYGCRKDGTEFPAEASISKLEESGGEILYTVILRDITLRKQSEDALASLSHENALILNSVGEGICGLDLQGRFTFINPAATHLLGYSRDQLIGRSIQVILTEPGSLLDLDLDEQSPIYFSLHGSGVQSARRETFWHRNGIPIPVEYISTPIREQNDIVGSVITFKDVTEREVVERMKDEFISVVSHELRTPLTSIHGSLGMLASGLLASDPTTSKRLLDIAVTSTERLVRLINDILDVERIESGKVKMHLQSSNSAELVRKAVDVMQPMAEKSGISLEVQAESVDFQADPDRLLQTLTNLLSNAIKFSPSGSKIWIAATLDQGSRLILEDGNAPIGGPVAAIARLLSPPAQVLFSVADRGRGIPEDKLETIFERFQQVDASDSRNQDGTGLGLAICRNIVQQHGGQIFVTSTLGEGSIFYFTIPLQDYDQEDSDY